MKIVSVLGIVFIAVGRVEGGAEDYGVVEERSITEHAWDPVSLPRVEEREGPGVLRGGLFGAGAERRAEGGSEPEPAFSLLLLSSSLFSPSCAFLVL